MSSDEEKKEPNSGTRLDLAHLLAAHWSAILQGLILLTLVYALARGLARTLLDAQVPTAAKYRVEEGGGSSGLRIVGWIEQDRAAVGLPLKIHYSFLNRSQAPIQLRFLVLEAPGFTQPPRLRYLKEFPLYLGSSKEPVSWKTAVLTVPPGRTVPARVEIVPYQRTGSSMVTSVFTWEGAEAAEQHESLELGPVRLLSPGLQFVSNALDTGMLLAQTVALPLVIALLGLLLQQVHQSYVHERQAWASMLPISHENNVKLYVPLLSGIQTFEGWLDALMKEIKEEGRAPVGAGRPNNPSCSQACFFLLFCLRRMREVDKNGWFYLTDRTAEKLVSDGWNCFVDRLLVKIQPYEKLSALLDSMTPDETFSGFLRKRKRRFAKALDENAGEVERQFEAWVREDGDLDFALLFLIRVLLLFEINQIYKFWYRSAPPFPVRECQELLDKLERRLEFMPLVRSVESYMRDYAASPNKPRPRLLEGS